MLRESQIPLFLWVATAIVVHLSTGGGATIAVARIEETIEIGEFARSVRQHVKMSGPMEVSMLEEPAPSLSPEAVEESEDAKAKPNDEEPAEENEETAKPEGPKPAPLPPPLAKSQEPEEKAPEPEPERLEEKKPEPEKKETEQEKLEREELERLKALQNRVAVVQDVEDKTQQDNPDARFLGDHANRVEKESQAQITATDEHHQKPTPGGMRSGAERAPGNAADDRIAQSEDRPGDPDRAPGDAPDTPSAPESRAPPAPAAAPPRAAQAPVSAVARAATPGQSAQTAQEARSAIPPTLMLPGGSFTMPEERAARAARAARRARAAAAARRGGNPTALLGLGSQAVTENGVSLNLTPSVVAKAVGQTQLNRERALDGERRRSEHRGTWADNSFERYRASIENYVAGVQPGNQTALNTAHSPFATYLNRIHNRLHPVFAGRFLASLASMPSDHPMNNMKMATNVEVVLNKEDGSVVRMGITKSSGVTAFDIGALDSIRRASPFGTPPEAIVSPDNHVYLHWEFHRLPEYACSTYFARPYLLKTKPKSAPPEVPPPPRKYDDEEAPKGDGKRHGQRASESGERVAQR